MPLQRVKDELLKSYNDDGGINHIDGSNLPSEESVHQLARDFMHLLFPGFFEQTPLTKDEVPARTEQRLERIFNRLKTEISKALSFSGGNDSAKKADEFSMALLEKLPELRRIIRTDVEAAYLGDPAARSIDEIILAYPCVLVISLQRIAHVLYKLGIPLIPRLLTEYAHDRTGTDIHPGAEIGSHFFIDHCTGVVIGETARLGHHVKIYQGVTLGAKSFELDEHGNPVKGVKRHPDIGNHVTIYPAATILGGKTVIGDNTIIGSNVWLMNSIPESSIVYYKGEVTSIVRNKDGTRKPVQSAEDSNRSADDWAI